MVDEKREVGYGRCVLVKADNVFIGGAIHEIEAGKQTDMFFHRIQEKIVYVLAGKVKVTVIRDGKVSSMDVGSGNSFYVKPGLIHQITAIDGSAVVVEFGSAEMYEDFNSVFKGTQLDTPIEAPSEEPPKTTKKKRTKKTSGKKKTTKKTTKKTSARKRTK